MLDEPVNEAASAKAASEPSADAAEHGAIQFPVIVGVTGHRDIDTREDSDVNKALRASVREILTHLKNRFRPGAVHLLTGAAAGADQLAASVALDLGIPLIVVAPMPLSAYRETMADDPDALDAFDRFWKEKDRGRTALRLELPWLTADKSHKLQYEQLGVILSRYSHLLLALWDGDEWRDAEAAGEAEGVRGGTAQVVHFRQWGESDAEAFAISRLFPGETSHLDLTPSGPLIHIMTPRAGTETEPPSSAPDDDPAGKMRLWQEKRSKQKQRASAIDEPVHFWKDLSKERLGRWTSPFLKEIVELNNGIAEAVRGHAAGVERHVGYIRPQHGDVVDRELFLHLEILRRLQAATDMAAQGIQRKLMGEGDTAMRSYSDFWTRFRLLFLGRGGAVFIFAITIPASVLFLGLFPLHCELLPAQWRSLCESATRGSAVFAVAYAVIIIAAGAFYRLRVRPQRWQEKFLDYRAIAEAMRVQVFWCLAAMPGAVSDYYLRKHFDELGWVQQALRGPALWAAAVALKLDAPQRDIIRECWLQNQRDWFVGPSRDGGRFLLNKQALDFNEGAAKAWFWSGVSVAFCLAFLAVCEAVEVVERSELAEGVLILLSTFAFGMAGFHGLYMEKQSFEAHAHAYARMGRLFNKALIEADKAQDDSEKYRAIMLELGREALAENADWLIDHRGRPIENPSNFG
ncbi:hypothetical protein [Rhodoblastus sp.]|uniref:hypothetical protein n=1 Tax=Rhodoblastus sp. TaxID=1962975 RepID=UPI0035B3073B